MPPIVFHMVEVPTGARAVVKALSILDVFSLDRPWWSLTEIAARLEMPASTVTRLLQTLEAIGAVQRDPTSLRYSAGPRTLAWAGVAQAASDLRAITRGVLETLERESGETAAVYLRQGDVVVCLDACLSRQEVHRGARIGEIAPLVRGGGGRPIAAYLPPGEQERLGLSAADRALLAKARTVALVAALRDGYKDAWSVSAPIKSNHGYAIASLVVAGPTSRYADGLFQTLGERVRAAAADISRKLGCLPTDLVEYSAPLDGIPVFTTDESTGSP